MRTRNRFKKHGRLELLYVQLLAKMLPARDLNERAILEQSCYINRIYYLLCRGLLGFTIGDSA